METDNIQMPYREKTAWLSLIAILVTFGPYFALSAATLRPGTPMPNLHQLSLFAGTVIAQIAIMAAGHAFFAIKWPHDARTPSDEREREIERRSITGAYYVLISGMIIVGCVMPFSSGGWTIINAGLFMIVLAEIVHYGYAVFSYRRQA